MSYASLAGNDAELKDLTAHTEPRSISRPAYDRGRPRLILLGLISTRLLGTGLLAYAVYGTVILHSYSPLPTCCVIYVQMSSSTRLLVTLALDVTITAGTEAAGFVHGYTLKWALAAERGLRFNANLRLFRASGGALSLNGWVVNVVFAVSPILAYASSSAIIISGFRGGNGDGVTQFEAVSPPALFLAGTTISLQAILGLVAYFKTLYRLGAAAY